ncbi:MAG: hypothetical protein A2139_06645 [Desulfobacca sp. RBG_16_60_12]|nr:MAG: hypothetical protein A2139_06645 [Desulfobacca sp. RBG_16_60_12]
MNRNTTLSLLALAAVALTSITTAQQGQSQTAAGGGAATMAQLQVGPSFEDLVEKLRDLRERKKYDNAHGRKYQAYLAEKIEMVKRALRNHHRSRGEKAARNEGTDYNPPK